MTILVTGGTGTLGSAVVAALVGRGAEVRVLSRTGATRRRTVTGDLLTGDGIDTALAGVATIIHCATTNGSKDVAATEMLVERARGVGDPHLVYVSIVGVDAIPLPYYRAKLACEQAIAASDLPFTIQRVTQFHNFIARIAAPPYSPTLVALSGVDFQPIDVRDAADRLVTAAYAEPAGRVPDIGGPEVRSSLSLTRAWKQAHRSRRPILPLPIPGAIGAGYRAGHHLTPEHVAGTITFEQYLQNSVGA